MTESQTMEHGKAKKENTVCVRFLCCVKAKCGRVVEKRSIEPVRQWHIGEEMFSEKAPDVTLAVTPAVPSNSFQISCPNNMILLLNHHPAEKKKKHTISFFFSPPPPHYPTLYHYPRYFASPSPTFQSFFPKRHTIKTRGEVFFRKTPRAKDAKEQGNASRNKTHRRKSENRGDLEKVKRGFGKANSNLELSSGVGKLGAVW